MYQIRQCSFLIIGFIFSVHVSAQTVHENTGWFAWFNSYKLSGHWRLHFDGQVRSGDNWEYVRTILLRPGITYAFNAKNNVTLGYAYSLTHNRSANGSKTTVNENRIWEQFVNTTKIGRASLVNRFRLEQRFIDRGTENVFAQRFRYFLRTIIPFAKPKNSFDKGFFWALQEEVFLNVQNKDKINNSLFDQNRAYAAIGYRLSRKIDLDAGYMNQYIKGMTTNTSNNIIQLAVYTRF
ncbi:MAG TPA: DUF2490 domain-containing protein [Chitinophagaceae bacterium]|jgi:uncharacterized protein DUF2490|nr:DUF2490 domain-containing protein [Chitinophagaceae bacterium]